MHVLVANVAIFVIETLLQCTVCGGLYCSELSKERERERELTHTYTRYFIVHREFYIHDLIHNSQGRKVEQSQRGRERGHMFLTWHVIFEGRTRKRKEK